MGMLHVDPPRPWTPTGKLEAMAEAVLEVLRSASVLDDIVVDGFWGSLPGPCERRRRSHAAEGATSPTDRFARPETREPATSLTTSVGVTPTTA